MRFKQPSYLRQLRNSIKRRGWWQTIALIPEDMKYFAYRIVIRFRQRDPEDVAFEREEAEFDRAMGIATAEVVRLRGLTVESENVLLGSTYMATPAGLLRQVLDGLSIDHAQFTFVDYGSGMGRVVFYAARFPYKRVMGVEFAEELHAVAMENARRSEGSVELLSRIEFVCMDAVKFEPPAGDLVCFFANPFAKPMMEKVMGKLTESLNADPRACLVVYLYPICREVIDDSAHWALQEEGLSFAIYRYAG